MSLQSSFCVVFFFVFFAIFPSYCSPLLETRDTEFIHPHSSSSSAVGEQEVGAFVGYKCRRSLDYINSLKPKHAPKALNCYFGPLEVTFAVAKPITLNDSATPAINLHVEALAYRPLINMTFSVRLKHMHTGNQIMYHGFDGKGFSACCDFIQNQTPESSVCIWETDQHGVQHRRTANCLLEASDEEFLNHATPDGLLPFEGQFTRPLHKLLSGRWEIDFRLRDSQGLNLGQVLAWAIFSEKDLGLDKDSSRALATVDSATSVSSLNSSESSPIVMATLNSVAIQDTNESSGSAKRNEL